jgi:hypothetical protein
MGLANNSALVAAGILMTVLLLWTLYDCISKEGHVIVLRSFINLLLAAIYITMRLSVNKAGNLIFSVTVLAVMLACMGAAELTAHLLIRNRMRMENGQSCKLEDR